MCFLETGSGKWLLKSCLLWALLLPGTAESLYSWVVIQVDALLAEEVLIKSSVRPGCWGHLDKIPDFR